MLLLITISNKTVHSNIKRFQVISFDGSTTVQEFLLSLNKAINMRDCALSGFALFTDDPNNPELEHCLKMHFKVFTPLKPPKILNCGEIVQLLHSCHHGIEFLQNWWPP